MFEVFGTLVIYDELLDLFITATTLGGRGCFGRADVSARVASVESHYTFGVSQWFTASFD
jgi:hypothetical protein